ncbi:hypothetical protein N7509_012170 [Penicillium cosmopolitanum]|uniref:Zn(2)-C6 fungal-type domain-containing protein n=1 Tax=Penicillium cosmopolitanum TaxID=1131564 RepID=A0A9W9SI54_9EURO|nr:uncharacterized protein N7509_012170 [Penicillium cosmopolitanum]KAJ5379051.1 hypothetical protein N7509_012170 [Penicillium cosmopolitanum]
MTKSRENHIPQSRGGRKVKTGCKTCKARRVKCDESRPACRRCISTGRICDGYGIWGGGGSPYGPPQPSKALSIYCTPVPAGSLDPEEQTCFDWFMRKTTTKFAGIFKSQFWETLVFQASAQEPAVRHAVVALSAAHRFDISAGSWVPAIYGVDAERFTLQQYNKAIYHLRSATMKNNASGSRLSNKKALRVALITCMLFVTLEYLRGQYKMGSAHLRYGIQLLADISAPMSRTPMAPGVLSPAEDFVHDALIDSYARLTVQSAMFGHVPSHLCVIVRDPQVHALPYTFSSLVEARRTLDDLLNRIHCLKRYIYTHNSHENEDNDIEYQPENDFKAFETQCKIVADLSLWKKAYNASISLLKAESQTEKIGFLLLRVYHEMAVVMASVCLSSEGRWSSTHTREIDRSLQNGESKCEGYSFTIESGFIPPMYYTGLKCRIPRIRRLAIRLLRAAPHREGVWNGPLLADVLEEVAEVEEGSSYTENYSKQDPGEEFSDGDFHFGKADLPSPEVRAESRVHDVKVLLPDIVGEDTFMSYEQKGDDGQWESFHRKVKRKGVTKHWTLF